jgi:hypothetical protein
MDLNCRHPVHYTADCENVRRATTSFIMTGRGQPDENDSVSVSTPSTTNPIDHPARPPISFLLVAHVLNSCHHGQAYYYHYYYNYVCCIPDHRHPCLRLAGAVGKRGSVLLRAPGMERHSAAPTLAVNTIQPVSWKELCISNYQDFSGQYYRRSLGLGS